MDKAERHQKIGEAAMELAEQQRRLTGLNAEATRLAASLKAASQRLSMGNRTPTGFPKLLRVGIHIGMVAHSLGSA